MVKHKLGLASEIPVGKAKKYVIEGMQLAVININGKFYALHDTCSHRGASLVETGDLQDAIVTCGWHGAKFNVMDGSSLSPIATNLRSFKIIQEGNDLFVEM